LAREGSSVKIRVFVTAQLFIYVKSIKGEEGVLVCFPAQLKDVEKKVKETWYLEHRHYNHRRYKEYYSSLKSTSLLYN